MIDFVGKTIENKYTIRERLGKGGMGSVYLVKDLKLDAFRAVKIIDKNTKHKIDQFTEVNIMKNVQHPYLPSVMDFSEDSEYIYIIMELITGTTLDNVLKSNGNIEEDKVIKWAKKICDVLSYLHNDLDYKVIYKDLKPSNIMVSADGERITLIDFGISQMVSKEKLEKNIRVGTKAYAPPEQFREEPIDERVDIYSLGVTLYHLLTGKNPKSLEEEFISLRQINPNLSEGIEIIVAKCIQEDPSMRYSSMKEVIHDLENVHKIGRQYEIKKKTKNYKVTGCLVGASLCAMLALGGWNNINTFINGKYNNFIEQGIAARNEFKFDEAEELFKKAQSYMSKGNTAYYEIAKTYMSKGSIDESIMYLNKTIEENSRMKKDENLNYLIGKAYFLKGRYDMSLEYFDKVKEEKNVETDYVHLHKISKELETLTATGKINLGSVTEALEGFELYIDSNTQDKFVASNLYIALANVYQNIPSDKMKDSTDRQIKILEKAYKINDGDYTVVERLSSAYKQKSRDIQLTDKTLRDEYVNKSLQMFQLCLSLQPTISVYSNIGDLYLEIGNFQQAESNYMSIISLNKDHYSGYVKMAGLRYAQGNTGEAIMYLDDAEKCKIAPENDPQYNNLRKTLG